MGEILSAEEVRSERYRYPDSTTEDGANDVIALCESHEALRRERDAALAALANGPQTDIARSLWRRTDDTQRGSAVDTINRLCDLIDALAAALSAPKEGRNPHSASEDGSNREVSQAGDSVARSVQGLEPGVDRCSRCTGTGVDPEHVDVNRTDAGDEYLATECIECQGTGSAPKEG